MSLKKLTYQVFGRNENGWKIQERSKKADINERRIKGRNQVRRPLQQPRRVELILQKLRLHERAALIQLGANLEKYGSAGMTIENFSEIVGNALAKAEIGRIEKREEMGRFSENEKIKLMRRLRLYPVEPTIERAANLLQRLIARGFVAVKSVFVESLLVKYKPEEKQRALRFISYLFQMEQVKPEHEGEIFEELMGSKPIKIPMIFLTKKGAEYFRKNRNDL